MADHPSLVTHSKTAMSIQHAPEDKPEELLTCRICFDEAEDAVMTSCRHIFCVRFPLRLGDRALVLTAAGAEGVRQAVHGDGDRAEAALPRVQPPHDDRP